MPFDIEGAAVLWINKLNTTNTNMHLRKRSTPPAAPYQDGVATRLRIRKDQVVETKVFPSVQTLFHLLNDGRSLLSVLLFYFPDAVKVESM